MSAVAALYRPDALLVERVEFVGNDRATPIALRHLVDLPAGTRMWQVRTRRVEERAEQHPWVRSAQARRVWPDRVVVELEEREPVALLLYQGLYYLDSDGVAFLRARTDDLDYPVLTGITPELEGAHPRLPAEVVQAGLGVLQQVDARGLIPADRVSEVSFASTRGFTLVLRSGAHVAFGLDDHERQLDRLAQLLKDHVDLEQPVLVDLAPARVAIVRPLDGAPQHP